MCPFADKWCTCCSGKWHNVAVAYHKFGLAISNNYSYQETSVILLLLSLDWVRSAVHSRERLCITDLLCTVSRVISNNFIRKLGCTVDMHHQLVHYATLYMPHTGLISVSGVFALYIYVYAYDTCHK